MRVIRAPSIGRAHEEVIKYILEHGRVVTTEDAGDTIEAEEVGMRIDTPLAEPLASAASRFQQRFLDHYARDLLEGSAASFEYDYHGRLFAWGEGLTGDEAGHRFNQVNYIIDKLRSAPSSRRALAITWIPPLDQVRIDCPCLQLVQCVVREGRLNMKVVFRSNDMLTAAGANMYALVHLQQHIAGQLGVATGSYSHISLVPHIYHLRDISDIPPFCRNGDRIRPIKEVCRACGKCPHTAAAR